MSKIFISHIAEEARIAPVIKEWIESTFAGTCKVFVASDVRNIPAGKRWLDTIDEALGLAAAIVVLCSPASLPRPWINFEMGCGWIKKVPIIPVCHSGQRKGELPPPISTFQALDMDSDSFVNEFFGSLAAHLKIEQVPRIDQDAMRKELTAALQLEPAAVREVAVVEAVSRPAPQEDLDDESRDVLKAIAEMGDEGFTAEDLARHFGMSRPKMEYYLKNLAKAGHVSYLQEIVDDPPVARLRQKGRTYLIERGLL